MGTFLVGPTLLSAIQRHRKLDSRSHPIAEVIVLFGSVSRLEERPMSWAIASHSEPDVFK